MSFLLKSAGSLGLTDLLPRVGGIPSIKIGVSIPSFLQPLEKSNKNLQEHLCDHAEHAHTLPEGIEIDAGILHAAPKKKTSHMKRRQRLYGPGEKHIKLKDNLNRCPACGNYKRSHFLCMHCVGQIRKYWKERDAPAPREAEEFVNPRDEQILYPGKTEREHEKKLQSKDWLLKRPKTLPVE
jgi:large subunit ribosomal protein L32